MMWRMVSFSSKSFFFLFNFLKLKYWIILWDFAYENPGWIGRVMVNVPQYEIKEQSSNLILIRHIYLRVNPSPSPDMD